MGGELLHGIIEHLRCTQHPVALNRPLTGAEPWDSSMIHYIGCTSGTEYLILGTRYRYYTYVPVVRTTAAVDAPCINFFKILMRLQVHLGAIPEGQAGFPSFLLLRLYQALSQHLRSVSPPLASQRKHTLDPKLRVQACDIDRSWFYGNASSWSRNLFFLPPPPPGEQEPIKDGRRRECVLL